MKTNVLRLLAAILMPLVWRSEPPIPAWLLKCPVCEKEFKSSAPYECPRCHFVWYRPFSKLSGSEQARLRRFVASDSYRASLSRPRWERVVLVYEQIERPAREMTGALLGAAVQTENSEKMDHYLKRALAVSEADLAKLPNGPEKDQAMLRVGDLLRCLGRFDAARGYFAELAARKNPAFPDSAALQQELDLVEIKFTCFRRADWTPAVGTLHASVSDATRANFPLPLHQGQIVSHPKGNYPLAMRYAGIVGEARFAVAVDESGAVQQAKMTNASQPDFIPDAEKFVRACRFTPWLVEGKPRAFECAIVVVFNLEEP